jgi:hypothetical protein
LIGRLYLTDDQMEQERTDAEEESSGEKELNLRPIHHKGSGTSGAQSGNPKNSGKDDDGEERENAELSAKWTLRKQAALLLDTVALSFPPESVLAAGNFYFSFLKCIVSSILCGEYNNSFVGIIVFVKRML